MIHFYYPEMRERPADGTQIEARLGHYGRHWYLSTPLTLKGRGITLEGTEDAATLTAAGQRKAGWHRYRVTEAALKKLAEVYIISSQMLL